MPEKEEAVQERENHPLNIIERIATLNDWPFEREGEDEITLIVSGKWSDYQVSFTWMGSIEVLHLACAFELKVPDPRVIEVQKLIALINEQLWVGHFDLWVQDGLAMFRHALVLAGGVEATDIQCQTLLGIALDTCESNYPAFKFVVWAGMPAREALDAAQFETKGEA